MHISSCSPLLAVRLWLTQTSSSKDATPTNPRGIPHAPFVEKAEDYVSSREELEPTLLRFQEMISYVALANFLCSTDLPIAALARKG